MRPLLFLAWTYAAALIRDLLLAENGLEEASRISNRALHGTYNVPGDFLVNSHFANYWFAGSNKLLLARDPTEQ